MYLLCVIQEWSSLLVCWNNTLVASEAKLLAENTWNGNAKGSDEKDAHDDECKDPLEGDGLREELANTKRSSQNAECETHGVVLGNVSNHRLYNQEELTL